MNKLKEAVISVVIDSLTETKRAKKDLLRKLTLARLKSDPRTDPDTQHPQNVGVRAAKKGLTPFGQKGGDVQRDKEGNILRSPTITKKGKNIPLLTPAGRITRTSRQLRGKPNTEEQALKRRAKRHDTANILASNRRRNEPGYKPPPSDEEIENSAWAKKWADHTDPLRW